MLPPSAPGGDASAVQAAYTINSADSGAEHRIGLAGATNNVDLA